MRFRFRPRAGRKWEKGERRENPGEAEIKPTMERTSEEEPTTSERAPRCEGRLGEKGPQCKWFRKDCLSDARMVPGIDTLSDSR